MIYKYFQCVIRKYLTRLEVLKFWENVSKKRDWAMFEFQRRFCKEYIVVALMWCPSVSSVQSLSCVRLFATPWITAHQASCLSPTPRVYSNSCPLSQWCHPTISSSVVPFSSCLQSLPPSESFPMSQLFTWGGQSIGVSASASVLPMNTQDWSPLGWTG